MVLASQLSKSLLDLTLCSVLFNLKKPVGKNTIGDFLPNLARLAGIKDYKKLYANTYEAWGKIADGEWTPKAGSLSGENLDLVKKNWQKVALFSKYHWGRKGRKRQLARV